MTRIRTTLTMMMIGNDESEIAFFVFFLENINDSYEAEVVDNKDNTHWDEDDGDEVLDLHARLPPQCHFD